MLKSERLLQIQAMLNKYGKVEVSNLCRIFNVTEMTIRRDLNQLEKQNLAIRSHGGAIALRDNADPQRLHYMEISSHMAEKEAIAAAAMPLIPNGSRLFFDSSTTVYCLARCLANTQNLLVVTDTLTTALELNSRTNIHVMCLGGELQKNTNSCSGIFAENMLHSMRFDYAFIGLYGISADGYLSTPSTSEFSLKRTVIEHSAHTVVLIDSSKLVAPNFLQLGHISEIDTIVTDSNAPQSFIDNCKQHDTNLIIANV
ncbi:MAG: DeoR/GlpR family DNA-binding transcription regulator [Lachnoclostridium edouardi]|uniref:DeoR/GlpR family DNA-binding transcription regulator n=1 Tax=Lachnoclostridium edouardi TaxID=1926283 RepID=UPI0026DC4760|nr:DeoR/GlpR family DNA-binding transcription regulator [Lachnoclostridium edouardi]MDO4277903.1 DeoR/GlpR family DNA-binding transcription regulator [Lachnoclostridium edouardi]